MSCACLLLKVARALGVFHMLEFACASASGHCGVTFIFKLGFRPPQLGLKLRLSHVLFALICGQTRKGFRIPPVRNLYRLVRHRS